MFHSTLCDEGVMLYYIELDWIGLGWIGMP